MKHLMSEGRRVRICFVVSSNPATHFLSDPAFIYRCENPGLFLAHQGHDVTFRHITQPPDVGSVDLVVFHRPRASWRLRLLLTRLRRAGVSCVADFDDLVFDPDFAAYSPGVVNGLNSLFLTRRKFRLHRDALAWFSHVTVSTVALAERVMRRHMAANILVLHNCVHWRWKSIVRPVPTQTGNRRVLSYLPGTRSHDKDFALIAGQLERFLRDHPDTFLRITGPLEFKLNVASEQILHERRVPFPEYPSRFSDVWANLAPLEQTPFNSCKSALKVLEAGYMGVPTLCSPNPDMARFTAAGAVIAGDARWYQALTRLRNSDYYNQVTSGLRERVLEQANVVDQAHALLELIFRPGRGGNY